MPQWGQASQFIGWLVIIVSLAVTSCSVSHSLKTEASQVSQPSKDQETNMDLSQEWRLMTEEEEEQAWTYILNSPLGIAALNQLAIEGFISPTCLKTFYLNRNYGGFQTMLQVKCPTAQGVSIAREYDEIRLVFNRFEDNIEDFQVERIPSMHN
jgi:hypothetical protein